MRNQVRGSRGERTDAPGAGHEPGFPLPVPAGAENDGDLDQGLGAVGDDPAAEDGYDDELTDVATLFCPDCSRPIAVPDGAERLPGHALCATPWDPFGLTVCAGSGRPVADARPLDGGTGDAEPEFAVLRALPAGLDWRTQPFSHVGGPGSRPLRASAARLAA
jgi:hypothetical protein